MANLQFGVNGLSGQGVTTVKDTKVANFQNGKVDKITVDVDQYLTYWVNAASKPKGKALLKLDHNDEITFTTRYHNAAAAQKFQTWAINRGVKNLNPRQAFPTSKNTAVWLNARTMAHQIAFGKNATTGISIDGDTSYPIAITTAKSR